jgi:hypothetical protein
LLKTLASGHPAPPNHNTNTNNTNTNNNNRCCFLTQVVTAALSPRCPFVATSEMGLNIEWLYKIPVFLLLSCNMLFLVWIMAVRFTPGPQG